MNHPRLTVFGKRVVGREEIEFIVVKGKNKRKSDKELNSVGRSVGMANILYITSHRDIGRYRIGMYIYTRVS